MKLSPVAFAVGAATIWGAAILVIGSANAIAPSYGAPVLELVVSLYPGYDANGQIGDLLLGTTYAVLDGLAAGAVFALIYNGVVHLTSKAGSTAAPPAEATADAANNEGDSTSA